MNFCCYLPEHWERRYNFVVDTSVSHDEKNSLSLVIKCQTIGNTESITHIPHTENREQEEKWRYIYILSGSDESSQWQKSCPVTSQEKIGLLNANSVA